MFEQLEVDWGEKDKFWEKSEESRYKYFRNATIQYLKVVQHMEEDDSLKKFASDTMLSFSNVVFFLVFLMTTTEEQENSIEESWLKRLKKDLKEDIFINYNQEGVA